jgi:hypothetical protein
MKNILMLFITLLTLSTVTYASFPVTENGTTTELVADDANNALPIANVEFNFGGFILGLLLGLIGVGLAYIFSDDEAFRRSAWYGLGTWAILLLIILAGAPA